MKEHFSNVAETSHPDAGKFYWTRNNIVAMLTGVSAGCPEFVVVNFTSAMNYTDGEPTHTFNTITHLSSNQTLFVPPTSPVCGVAHGGAYGPGFDIVAELTEEEIEYFVPRGE